MSSFQVAYAELQRIHGHIDTIAMELQNVTKGDEPHINAVHNNTGYGRVEASIHHFFGEWSDGMNQMRKNLTGLGHVLGEAEKAYAAAEAKIQACAGGKGG